MSEIISKELLSEVFSENVTHAQKGRKENEICVCINGETTGSFINIYELAFDKCIKWASLKGYQLSCDNTWLGLGAFIVRIKKGMQVAHSVNMSFDIRDDIGLEYKPEAIFKACQWILENKEK